MTLLPQTFLLCDSAEHADLVDQLVVSHLRDVEHAHGSSWSGVYTDGTRFGILWASPCSEVFGSPSDDPSLVLVDEVFDTDGASDWYPLPSPDPEPSSLPS